MRYIETLVKIAREQLEVDKLDTIYPWEIHNLVARSKDLLKLNLEQQGLFRNEQSAFEQNRALKTILSDKLSNNQFDFPILFWIIKEWGGIRAFKSESGVDAQNAQKIRDFNERVFKHQNLTSDLFKIIPSLSKLASFWDPTRFTIYDNRAVYTLNYLIYKANERGEHIKYFPIRGGSRNKMITEKPIENLIGENNSNGFHDEGIAYFKFCEMVLAINGALYPGFSHEPFRTEMLLFSSIAVPFQEMDGKFHNLSPKIRGKIKDKNSQRSAPLNPKQKYFPLQQLLFNAAARKIHTISFNIGELNKEISQIGKGELPEAAFKYQVFWGNDFNSPTHMQKRAWLSQGFVVANLENVVNSGNPIPTHGRVTFQFLGSYESSTLEILDEQLEIALAADLANLSEKIQNEVKINCPRYFSDKLKEGAVITLSKFVESEVPDDGFTILLLLGRLDLTLEFFLVNNEKYHSLFSESLLEKAKSRIGR